MKAFFFGSSNRQLFGVYHPPRATVARDAGVLLCYPGIQEYNAAHWAFRKLAGMLAREGFHVLRFDWFGTGDSAGDASEGRPDLWLQDLETAARELRDASGVTSTAIVGMRLGAALATLACRDRRVQPSDLLLWEPVVSGAKYVSELDAQDRRENFQLLHGVHIEQDELVGYPFPPSLRESLMEIDLFASTLPSTVRTSIWSAVDRPDCRALRDALSQGGSEVTFRHVPEDASRTNVGVRESALLSNTILVAMSNHVARKPQDDSRAHA